MAEVGSGQVAIFPTFKGFRSAVSKETDSAAKESTRGFRNAWSKEGTASGKETGSGFRRAFEADSKGFTNKSTQELERAVAKSARALSQARMKQLDQVGKVRVAERQLAEAQSKYANDSSQVVRAMERLQTATRQLERANEDTEQSTKDLREAQTRLASAADNAGDELRQSGRRGAGGFKSGFLDGLKGFGPAIVAGIATLGIGSLVANAVETSVNFAMGAIDIASDLGESVNAVAVSYGEASDAVLALGSNSVDAFGLSKRSLNGFAVQFSAFAKTIRGSDVAGFLDELITRGADFASVYNLEVADALALFQSGLAGESEPLRKYGLDLSAATVQSYAYASGIAASGTELTEAQKQQARYGLLLEQTNQVQGDWINTADSLANTNRRNAATWDDLQAKIGEGFLPIATELASILESDVFPIIQDLVNEHGPAMAEAFAEIAPELSELAVDLLPQLPGLIQSIVDAIPALISAAQVLLPPLVSLIQATSGWWTSIDQLFKLLSGETSLGEFAAKLTNLTGPIGAVWRAAQNMGIGISVALNLVKSTVGSFASDVGTNIEKVKNWFRDLPGNILAGLGNLGTLLYNSGRAVIQGFLNGITAQFGNAGAVLGGFMSWVRGFFPSSPAKRGPFSGSGWTALEKSGAAVMEQWQSGFGRPDLTGALTPALAATSPSGAVSAFAGRTGPGAGDRWEMVLDDGSVLTGYVRRKAGAVTADFASTFRGGVR